MKKLLFICLLALLTAGLIFATGSSQSSGSGSVIELWHCQTDSQGPAIFNRAGERFTRNNPSIRANIVPIQNDMYKQRLAVAMNAGQTPDVFFSWSGGPMYEYVKNNQIADLTSYMNANNYKNRFLDASIAQSTYQGKIWAVPVTNVSVCMVFYDKQIFSRLNLSVPTTIRELETVCDTLKANGITPFSLANLTQWTGSMYFMFFATRRGGVQPFINGVDGSGSFTDPAFIYAGEKIQDWVNKGYFLPGFNGLDWDSGQARAPLYRGETAMLVMGSWFIGQAQSESPEFYQRMGMFQFPRDEQGSGNPNTVIGTVGDNFFHVSTSSRNQAKAFELIQSVIDDTAVQEGVADGRIPPVKGLSLSGSPLLAELSSMVQAAPDIQLWYDQSLSPEVAEVHKVTSQQIFGLTLTPRAAADALQAAQAAYLRQR